MSDIINRRGGGGPLCFVLLNDAFRIVADVQRRGRELGVACVRRAGGRTLSRLEAKRILQTSDVTA